MVVPGQRGAALGHRGVGIGLQPGDGGVGALDAVAQRLAAFLALFLDPRLAFLADLRVGGGTRHVSRFLGVDLGQLFLRAGLDLLPRRDLLGRGVLAPRIGHAGHVAALRYAEDLAEDLQRRREVAFEEAHHAVEHLQGVGADLGDHLFDVFFDLQALVFGGALPAAIGHELDHCGGEVLVRAAGERFLHRLAAGALGQRGTAGLQVALGLGAQVAGPAGFREPDGLEDVLDRIGPRGGEVHAAEIFADVGAGGAAPDRVHVVPQQRDLIMAAQAEHAGQHHVLSLAVIAAHLAIGGAK